MRVYTSLSDKTIEIMLRSKPSKKENIHMIYSEDGIYVVNHKVYKMLLDDKLSVEQSIDGKQFIQDFTIRTLQERWQIPVPNDSVYTTVYTFVLEADLVLVIEKSSRTTYYFETTACEKIVEWLKKLTLLDM